MPDGFVCAPLIEAGLVPETADEPNSGHAARLLEWKRKLDPKLKPDSSDDFRKQVVERLGFMRRIPKRAQIWHAVEDLIASSDQATGRLRLETVDTEQGQVRYIRVLGRRDFAKRVMDVPDHLRGRDGAAGADEKLSARNEDRLRHQCGGPAHAE